jgi:hypothetical protein
MAWASSSRGHEHEPSEHTETHYHYHRNHTARRREIIEAQEKAITITSSPPCPGSQRAMPPRLCLY